MGCGGSKDAGGDVNESLGNEDDNLKSKELEERLEREQAEENAIIKLLVLGTGESGKSTVFKQMKILYSVPDPPSKYILICRANLFSNANAVMDGMERLEIAYGSPEGEEAGKAIKVLPSDGNLAPEEFEKCVAYLAKMFADSGVQEAIERAAEYQLNDSTVYFWERASEICSSTYMPTEQDVLRARVRTTGIVQQNFQITDKKYTMFDVGGQRNERRKWIHCFDNVTAVIFVTAISEYDQVLYEDENTNRMDEALILFDQICNHPSFKKTSMILFLNKRDLFEIKLKKKDLTCWRDGVQFPEIASVGQDYDKAIKYLEKIFLEKNKEPQVRQVYVHATCATDTNNISFVMESVFDIILKDNLRKLAVGDVDSMIELAAGTGVSGVKTGADIWNPDKSGKIILAACFYTETLSERKVLITASGSGGELPAVQICTGLSVASNDLDWMYGLGKDLPVMPVFAAEQGSFKGDFKEAAEKLRSALGTEALGYVYDTPIVMTAASGAKTTLLLCVKQLKDSNQEFPGMKYSEHEAFENACYKRFDNKDTDANPCAAPNANEEFNPFAANPVGFRWFKGVTLFNKQVTKIPDKGVYLGVFFVLSAAGGFKVMVNEHDRISIPMIFLTETQLDAKDMLWVRGVRTREEKFGVDLLEGAQPNRGWLGPEMSGEEGASFPEKLWWAVDEAKFRLGGGQDAVESVGKQYDSELLFLDEQNNIQLLIFGLLAKDSSDLLPGHIWIDKSKLLVENMKYLCPKVLAGMVAEQQGIIKEIISASSTGSTTMTEAEKLRTLKGNAKSKLKEALASQTPLKWVDRVIMWCADKMPSMTDGMDKGTDADAMVTAALASQSGKDLTTMAASRASLIAKYAK